METKYYNLLNCLSKKTNELSKDIIKLKKKDIDINNKIDNNGWFIESATGEVGDPVSSNQTVKAVSRTHLLDWVTSTPITSHTPAT